MTKRSRARKGQTTTTIFAMLQAQIPPQVRIFEGRKPQKKMKKCRKNDEESRRKGRI